MHLYNGIIMRLYNAQNNRILHVEFRITYVDAFLIAI